MYRVVVLVVLTLVLVVFDRDMEWVGVRLVVHPRRKGCWRKEVLGGGEVGER